MRKFYIFLIGGLFSCTNNSNNTIINNYYYTQDSIVDTEFLDTLIIDTLISKPKNKIKVGHSSSKFENYIQTPLRQKLMSATLNDGTINPRYDDAGNWTGCQCGKGKLVGTYRDISACAYTAIYKKVPTVQDMRSLTYKDSEFFYRWIWNSIKAGQIPSQNVANIVMHIKVHFGNIKVVQNGINSLGYKLKIDGGMGQNTLKALQQETKKDSTKIYNAIRKSLKNAYMNSSKVYRRGFMKELNNHFPVKETLT